MLDDRDDRDERPPHMPPGPPVPPPVDLVGAVESGSTGFIPPPAEPPDDSSQDATPTSDIGDIPPPPEHPVGVAGMPGEGGTTFTPPGPGLAPFRSPAFTANRMTRFGPGVPMASAGDFGNGAAFSPFDQMGDFGLMEPITDDSLAQILAAIAGRYK